MTSAPPRPGGLRPALSQLPLGAVRPAGWLLDQLRLQAAGLTGQLGEVWTDVGPDSAWLGGTGEDWERGPYYLDGMLPLAFLLDDGPLLAKARTWVEAILDSQDERGQFGPTTSDDWWPRMVALKALTQYADATGDPRVPHFVARYCAFQARELPGRPLTSWGRVRGADNVLSVLWLHERTGDAALLDLAQLLLAQTADWCAHLTRDLSPEPTRTFSHLDHSVNVAMGLKTEAVAALVVGGPPGDSGRRAATEAMLASVERLHGLVHGVFSGDEWLAGRDPHHGVETCQVVEHMFTLEQLTRIHGDGAFADRLELAAFNLLPASCDPRALAHQYHQQANQVRVSVDRRDWTYSGDDANVFGLEPHFGCCTANLHQGWPKFASSLWMATPDGGLAAVSYAPCTVDAAVGGSRLRLEVSTAYPFEESVRIQVTDGGGDAPLRLRIPGWCDDPALVVGGDAFPVTVDADGFVTVRRTWAPGDALTLTLPMAVRTVARDRGAVGVRLGPLVMVLSPGESWHPVPDAPGLGEWHVSPRRSWNHGLWVEAPGGPARWPVTRHPVGQVPFALAAAPVHVMAPVSQVREWLPDAGSTGPLPSSPVHTSMPVERAALVPYGSARLRIAEFPVVHVADGAAAP